MTIKRLLEIMKANEDDKMIEDKAEFQEICELAMTHLCSRDYETRIRPSRNQKQEA